MSLKGPSQMCTYAKLREATLSRIYKRVFDALDRTKMFPRVSAKTTQRSQFELRLVRWTQLAIQSRTNDDKVSASTQELPPLLPLLLLETLRPLIKSWPLVLESRGLAFSRNRSCQHQVWFSPKKKNPTDPIWVERSVKYCSAWQ